MDAGVEDLHRLADEAWQPEPASAGLRDRLRARRQEIAGRETVDLPIPGYRGELVGRYKLVTTETVNGIGERVRRQTNNLGERELFASIDLILAACVGLYAPHPASGEMVGLGIDEDGQGVIMRYDARLAEFLEVDVDPSHPARSIVLGTFYGPAGRPNELGIIEHAQRLQAWLADTSRKVDTEFLG